MQEPGKICVVLGMVRSGTTVFRKMLASHPAIHDLGEVLAPVTPGNYYEYLESRLRDDPTLCWPKYSTTLFGDFLEDCSRRVEPHHIAVCDLKYENFQVVYRQWDSVGLHPAIFDVIRKKADFVLHLTRRDYLRRLLSNQRAAATKVFHVRRGEEYEDSTSIRIPTHDLVKVFEEIEYSYLKTQSYFFRIPGFLQVDYSRLFENSDGEPRFEQRLVEAISNLMDVESDFEIHPKLRKTGSRPLSQSLANYDEVAQILRGTRFEDLLEEPA